MPFMAGLFAASTAIAHELWLEPREYVVAPGETVEADIRVGQEFKGPTYSYLKRNFRRFNVESPGRLAAVRGRDGDSPAAQVANAPEGLMVLVYETTDLDLKYSEFAKFEKFVTSKDLQGVLEAHRARNLPDAGFFEVYSRYAKSLVAVGNGAGSDRAFGLETEIVALANPYTDDLTDGMPLKVLYQGAPRADAQVEVFAKGPGLEVAVSVMRTDAAGEVRVPVTPGIAYQIDAVVAREPSPDVSEANRGAVWETLWANLTFMVPEE